MHLSKHAPLLVYKVLGPSPVYALTLVRARMKRFIVSEDPSQVNVSTFDG